MSDALYVYGFVLDASSKLSLLRLAVQQHGLLKGVEPGVSVKVILLRFVFFHLSLIVFKNKLVKHIIDFLQPNNQNCYTASNDLPLVIDIAKFSHLHSYHYVIASFADVSNFTNILFN